MAIEQTRESFRRLLANAGRAVAHGTFKNDFEFYAFSLELLDVKGRIVEMLIFPVNPSSVEENTKTIANVKKSSSGVISLYNPSFVPFDINLRGNFGRKFRLLLGQDLVSGASFAFEDKNVIKDGSSEFNISVKTGYGVTKILERILKNAYRVDNDGNSFTLLLNNLAFNSSYVVEPMNYSFSQSESQNMIWQYSLSFKAIAPATLLRGEKKSSLLKIMTFSALQNSINNLVDSGLQQVAIEQNKKLVS